MILPGSDTNFIAAGEDCIRAGRLLGLPTETVYGLAADADNDAAVAQIFAAKGRPADHPLIVHVADGSVVDHYASDVPDFARALMATFWPGPLTLILPRRAGVANGAAGGNPTVGLRCPSHPVAQALLHELLHGGPITPQGARPADQTPPSARPLAPIWGLAAPSANQFGRVSPTTAAHVQGEFGDALLILDGGPCSVGIESSIIDCTRGQPVLLRPGSITPEQVLAACGVTVLQKEELSAQAEQAPKASGTLDSHYAPRARVRLMDAATLQAGLDEAAAQPVSEHIAPMPRLAVWARTDLHWPRPPHAWLTHESMALDATTAAQQLFATLRALDAQGVREICVETPPDSPEWDGVRDRLQRAAH